MAEQSAAMFPGHLEASGSISSNRRKEYFRLLHLREGKEHGGTSKQKDLDFTYCRSS